MPVTTATLINAMITVIGRSGTMDSGSRLTRREGPTFPRRINRLNAKIQKAEHRTWERPANRRPTSKPTPRAARAEVRGNKAINREGQRLTRNPHQRAGNRATNLRERSGPQEGRRDKARTTYRAVSI